MLPPLHRLTYAESKNVPTVQSATTTTNLAETLFRVSLVFALIGGLVLYFTRQILFPHQRRALTLTEVNTLLNRHENGGTGVLFRKWRKRLLPPPVFGDEAELAEAEAEEAEEAQRLGNAKGKQYAGDGNDAAGRQTAVAPEGRYSFTCKPQPEGLRSCLKRLDATVMPSSDKATLVSSSPTRSTPIERASDDMQMTDKAARRVRIVEPELAELEHLREVWSAPEMQAMTGSAGIGGYRRTRDFYSRSQGGPAVVKRPGGATPATTEGAAATGLHTGSLIPATKADDDSDVPVIAEPDGASSGVKSIKALSRLNASASPSARQTSPASGPTSRRNRTLSPNANGTARSASPAFIVGSQASKPARRRPLSPAVGSPSVTAGRTASPVPNPAAAIEIVAGPRWLRNKSGSAVTPAANRKVMAASTGESTSEHETTDDDAEDGPRLDGELSETETADSSIDGTTTPPSSSLGSVLTVLTGLDALAATEKEAKSGIKALRPGLGDDSPASILSGGESPQDSPTPAIPRRASSSAPAIAQVDVSTSVAVPTLSTEAPASPITPSPLKTSFSADEQTPASLETESSGSPPALPDTTPADVPQEAAASVSPSPCVAAQDRRLSLRVQQALLEKHQKRRASAGSAGSRGDSLSVHAQPSVPLNA
ncbi:hypothetical protein BMF94_6141 [Rhodotorula taiwanensis]|uniref:Uncharacterized protein n=1 Tax=Rhodotorula taiwanensis TaxID=741276 RepID=A0A2S5B217_9BASI|nr:hypothetical protein BMF94_6141 [Rhodotorula taiwanensis]